MMTSSITNPVPELARSVRDIVAHQPDLVNEVWCRKIFRQILQILEREHALKRIHAPITPDTVGIDELNEPVLVAAAPGAAEPGEAADVQALGTLIHYAITKEEVPAMSLRKRGLADYSDSLITAVDKCNAADPAERPQTIAELRNLLGIVALGPVLGTQVINPVYMQAPELPRTGLAGMSKATRWTLIGLATVVLLGAASAYWMMLRDTSSDENIVLSLPGAEPESQAPVHEPQPASAASALAQSPAPDAAPQAPQAPAQAALAEAQAALAQPAAPAPTPERKAATGTTSYKLFIKPWGTVYVNGRERGVSPPLKVLTLPPGNHTVRVVNPAFRDRIIKVHAISHGTGQIDVDFTD